MAQLDEVEGKDDDTKSNAIDVDSQIAIKESLIIDVCRYIL